MNQPDAYKETLDDLADLQFDYIKLKLSSKLEGISNSQNGESVFARVSDCFRLRRAQGFLSPMPEAWRSSVANLCR